MEYEQPENKSSETGRAQEPAQSNWALISKLSASKDKNPKKSQAGKAGREEWSKAKYIWCLWPHQG